MKLFANDLMKNTFRALIIPVVAVLLLNSCSTSPEEMQKHDSDALQCTPIQDIIDLANGKGINRLTIDERIDDNTVKHYGVISWVVSKVTEVIKDASLKIYLKIAINLDFRFLVAMMMTLSVVLFAASVLLGLTQANGYNALMFVLKLIIIYQLTINYFYFYTYVIQTFEAIVTDTMMFSSMTFSDYLAVDPTIVCLGLFGQACDIASIVGTLFFGSATALTDFVTGLFGGSGDQVRKLFLFNAFDDTLSFFYDVRMWKLVLALAGTGMTGIFWAGMVFLMQILYLFAIIAAVKVYLLSYIGRWALYGLGPIFISFALFKQTKSLFDGWLKQIISFTLQPVLLFIFLGMFQSMISGFTTQLYINIADPVNGYIIQSPADPNTPGAVRHVCTGTESGCVPENGENVRYYVETTANAQPMCVRWNTFDKKSDGTTLYWYRLCQQVSTDESCMTHSIKPMIPIDPWMVMSIIVLCYLMFAMCSWVTEVANSLAEGAMSMSSVRIMGWDRLKQGVGKGAGGLLRSATRANPGEGAGR